MKNSGLKVSRHVVQLKRRKRRESGPFGAKQGELPSEEGQTVDWPTASREGGAASREETTVSHTSLVSERRVGMQKIT